jgi:hypothetical protein
VWQIFGLPSRLVLPQGYQPQNPLEAEEFHAKTKAINLDMEKN